MIWGNNEMAVQIPAANPINSVNVFSSIQAPMCKKACHENTSGEETREKEGTYRLPFVRK